nr:proline-rich receptor-like protein kinase PERK9 [Aegilops tauschii subsp. strangulata]
MAAAAPPVLDLFSNQAQTQTRFDVATTSPRRRSASPDLLEPTAFALRPRCEAPGLSLSPRPRRHGRRSPHTHALPLTYRVGRLRPAPLPAARPCSTLASPDLRPPLPATPSASPAAAHLRGRSARPGYARPPLPPPLLQPPATALAPFPTVVSSPAAAASTAPSRDPPVVLCCRPPLGWPRRCRSRPASSRPRSSPDAGAHLRRSVHAWSGAASA